MPLGGFLPETESDREAVAHVSALPLRLITCDGRKEEEQGGKWEKEEEEGSN